MEEVLSVIGVIFFLVLPIVLIGSIAAIVRYRKQIKEARKKYTVTLKAKCVLTERMTMSVSTEVYLPDELGRSETSTHTHNFKVDRPTYSCDYAGHNRCFCNRTVDYKPRAVKGGMYTIYINPEDEKYRDFKDEFFFEDRRKKVIRFSIMTLVCSLILLLAVVYFYTLIIKAG